MTPHNKFGLAGGQGIPEDRSKICPFSLMLFDGRCGWEQHGVYRTYEEAEAAGVELEENYGWQTGIADTVMFLECEDRRIFNLVKIQTHPLQQLAQQA